LSFKTLVMSSQTLMTGRAQSQTLSMAASVPAYPCPALARRETLPRKLEQNHMQPSWKTTASWEKSLSVLAFGDSLTVGMISGSTYQPYGSCLADLLGVPAESVRTSGLAGQMTGDMVQRLQQELRLSARKPFTHVVILAGTNDLREGLPPETVVSQLTGLHSMVRASGAKCVAVTIPRFGPVPFTGQRNEVNAALRAMAASPGQGTEPLLQLADLDQAIESLPASEQDSLFSDSVHFSACGYKLLGEVAYNAIMGIAASTASSRPLPVPTGVHTARMLMSSKGMAATVTVRMPLTPMGTVVRFQQAPTSPALVGRSLGSWTRPPARRSAAAWQCQPVVGTGMQSTVRHGTSCFFTLKEADIS